MSLLTFYVRPHLLCLSPTIIFFTDKAFLNLNRLGNIRVCLECFLRVFWRGLEGSMVSLSLRKGHFQKIFWNQIFPTLGSIFTAFLPHSGPTWEFQLCLKSCNTFKLDHGADIKCTRNHHIACATLPPHSLRNPPHSLRNPNRHHSFFYFYIT